MNPNHSTQKLAASYGRKSDKNDQGVRDQHDGNTGRARRDGFTIPDSPQYRFGDDDTSGTTKSRREWDRLVQLVQSGQAPFSRVYIKDKTRFGRWTDPRFQFYWPVLFEQYGVRILFSEVDHQPDYAAEQTTPETIGLFLRDAVDGIVASEERTRHLRRITSGMRKSVIRGFWPGSAVPYGTQRWLCSESGTLYEPVPAGQRLSRPGCRYKLQWAEDGSADVVRKIFGAIEAGKSLASIADELTAAQTPTPGRSRQWSVEAVRRIVRNPIYCGDVIWGRGTRDGDPVEHTVATEDGKEAVLYRDFLPGAPVTRTHWEAVQKILDGTREHWHKRRATSPDFLLSGLLACEHCGKGWHGYTSSRLSGDTRRRYYRHELARGRAEGIACPANNRYLRAEALEKEVLGCVWHVLRDERLVHMTEEAIGERQRLLGSMNHAEKIDKAEEQLRRKEAALDRAMQGHFEASTDAERESSRRVAEALGRDVDHLRRRLENLKAERDRLARLEEHIAPGTRRTQALLDVLERCSPEERKELLATLVEKIHVRTDLQSATLRLRAL